MLNTNCTKLAIPGDTLRDAAEPGRAGSRAPWSPFPTAWLPYSLLSSELDDGVKPRACLVPPFYFTDEETEAPRGTALAQTCVLDTFLSVLSSMNDTNLTSLRCHATLFYLAWWKKADLFPSSQAPPHHSTTVSTVVLVPTCVLPLITNSAQAALLPNRIHKIMAWEGHASKLDQENGTW